MTEAKDTKLMDTAPGGEQTQYEGQSTFVESHSKDSGTFADPSASEAKTQASKEARARGEKTAENIRYGEAISEHGFGGETKGVLGEACQGGRYGRRKSSNAAKSEDVDFVRSRRDQGYVESEGDRVGG